MVYVSIVDAAKHIDIGHRALKMYVHAHSAGAAAAACLTRPFACRLSFCGLPAVAHPILMRTILNSVRAIAHASVQNNLLYTIAWPCRTVRMFGSPGCGLGAVSVSARVCVCVYVRAL